MSLVVFWKTSGITETEILHRYFRMSEERFNDLVCRVENKLKHAQTHKMPISTSERVAVTLRILASGSTQQSVAESYRLGESTVNGIFYETCKAIWEVLSPDFVRYPTVESWKQIAEDFQVFLECLDAIDGKHVTIKAPPNSGNEYFNYKYFHWIILLAVVDARYTFSMVSIWSYGRESDGGIFTCPEFGRRMASNSLDIPAPLCLPGTNLTCTFVFVGVSAEPAGSQKNPNLEMWTPLSRQQLLCTTFSNVPMMLRFRNADMSLPAPSIAQVEMAIGERLFVEIQKCNQSADLVRTWRSMMPKMSETRSAHIGLHIFSLQKGEFRSRNMSSGDSSEELIKSTMWLTSEFICALHFFNKLEIAITLQFFLRSCFRVMKMIHVGPLWGKIRVH